jgi:hypothetical protein
MSQNAEIWLSRGVEPSGHDRCDEAMRLMMQAVSLAGPALADVVFAEAKFQGFELPKRTPRFQRANAWKGR